MPNGLDAGHSVIAAPPATPIFLSVLSPGAQKAIHSPSGENTGSVTPLQVSVPGSGCESKSPKARRYRRWFATYTILLPSGDIATRWRPMLVNCCPSASGTDNRVVGDRGI